ncbi:amidase [Reyranella sp.]|uniref:amidase n=1 Tax=Reyranella sp. TaxID=1929291 RepID=UPI002726AB6A|nr:amidase [Reyranella sp.]MDO8974152.1 amidase [Reyranella sp.]
MEDLFATRDALAVAELVRSRQIGVREVLDATLARLREANVELNAITDFYEDELLGKSIAAAGDGPFHGIPFVVKQLMADCAGTPTTVGSRFFAKEPVALHDSAAVARMRRAGLVIAGRSNTSEFGLAPTTEPAFGGATVNPWRADLSPGGSSGGSAAVVAARALPMAHATDGGGSIRIPASLCGLFGLKPSRGRISLAPIGETLAGAGAQLCVSISVRDSAALLEALAGGEPGDPYRAPEAEGSFLEATRRSPARLRIAFLRKPVGWETMDPALVAAVEQAAKRLEVLGHHVEEAVPDYDPVATGIAFGTVMCANTFTNIQVRANGRVPGPGDLEPVTQLYAEQGGRISAHDYIRAVQTFHRTGRQLGAFFERFDILLSPTIARPSLPLGTVRMDGTLEEYEAGLAPMVAFTSVCNAAGVPAMSVPLEWTEDGLPIGMHFVARYGAEATLLSLAAQLEQAHPWRERWPGRVT